MKELNYSKDMSIDENALDLEWLNQPELEAKYIKKCSELRKERDWAWEEVKTVRSELIRDANEDPDGTCHKAKPNANDIEAYYRTHQDYKDAKEELIEAEDALKVLEDMKDSIHFTRTKALENLVRLHSEEYFAGPRVPRNLLEEKKSWSKKKKEISKKIGAGMKRKKKK